MSKFKCPSGARFDTVKNACVPRRKGRYYKEGYDEGETSAFYTLAEKGGRAELKEARKQGRIGEIVGEIRSNQVQMAGDISYDVGDTITEKQYESWDEGFTHGYMDRIEVEFKVLARRRLK
jgi:hypothetical protein